MPSPRTNLYAHSKTAVPGCVPARRGGRSGDRPRGIFHADQPTATKPAVAPDAPAALSGPARRPADLSDRGRSGSRGAGARARADMGGRRRLRQARGRRAAAQSRPHEPLGRRLRPGAAAPGLLPDRQRREEIRPVLLDREEDAAARRADPAHGQGREGRSRRRRRRLRGRLLLRDRLARPHPLRRPGGLRTLRRAALSDRPTGAAAPPLPYRRTTSSGSRPRRG